MNNHSVISIEPLGFPWRTLDPFLFCVHHVDDYPAGNEVMGPDASLEGRRLGQDFEGIDGWRMYHGEVVPGFPHHPHRGFETVTIVRSGYIDHTDSLGAAARYGNGDVQWLTAGRGVNHAEMFPLLEREQSNPLELFQIWLNLPRDGKFAEPYFTMFWSERIPSHTTHDEAGKTTEVTVIAGELDGSRPPAPPPDSWASRPESDVAIWTIRMEPGAHFALPPAHEGSNRAVYFFSGHTMNVGDRELPHAHSATLRADVATTLVNGDQESELLLLQGRPIGEPVVQQGPFVMNSADEIRQAWIDYQRTQFGGWPWPSAYPVHARNAGRFARHADGREEHGA